MNKLALLLIAFIVVASSAFKMKIKDTADDALQLQQDLQDWIKAEASTVQSAYEQKDPAGAAAAEKFVNDFKAASADIQAQFQDAYNQLSQYAKQAVSKFAGQ